ncbi:unnamed protein product [Caenorhabditis auriculariae]|uniref:Ubiquitin carboxyl-terminal hydrolase n=1 Tax=Caenorhabditis auriculariae TaxID=2777116 RepID=A0A8S1GVJ9_9PELO|nr:unnamed protein product [Caenorhabditis auriculariae]
MDSSGLTYNSLSELQALSEIPRELLNSFDKKNCEETYKSFKKLVEEARAARGDFERQYIFYMRGGELAKLIKEKNGYKTFINQPKNKFVGQEFYNYFMECVDKGGELQTLLAKKYDNRILRLDKNERASLDSSSDCKENEGPHVLPKFTISPKELVRMVESERPKKSAMIFDYRKDKSEIIRYPNDHLITVIRIPNELIEPKLIYTHLKQKLDVGQRTLLGRLNSFDHVVLMEEDEPAIKNGDAVAGSKANILFKALYEYSGKDNGPKKRPMFMEGGYAMWRLQYPTYTFNLAPSTLSARPIDDLDDAVQKYKRDESLNTIVYPDLFNLQIKEKSNVLTEKKAVNQGNDNQTRTETTFYADGVGQVVFPARGPSLPNSNNVKIDGQSPAVIPPRPTAAELNAVPHLPHRNGQLNSEDSILKQKAVSTESIINDVGPVAPPSVDRANKPPLTVQSQNPPGSFGIPLQPGLGKLPKLNGGEKTNGFSQTPPTLPNMPPVQQSVPFKPTPQPPQLDRGTKPPLVTPEREASLLKIYEQMRLALAQSPSRHGHPMPGHTGLYNMGNTCFMSATLQCLFHTPQLCDVFTRENFLSKINPQNKLGTQGVISAVFAALADIIWSGQYSAIRPQRFLQLFASQVNSSLADGEQHDASEFQLFLLDALHEDTNQVINRVSFEQNYRGGDRIAKDAEDYAQKSRKFAYSPVNKILNIQTVSELTCASCAESSATFEESTLLSVELPSDDRPCSLTESLRSHFSETRLDGDCRWNCPRCKKARPAVRKTRLWTLPPVLVIHLKRFSLVHGEYVKNTAAVAFDTKLDANSFLHAAAPHEKLASYKLYAITNHVGRLNSGHYTALASHLRSGKWLRFDDESVSSAEVSSVDHKSAYILFFKRQ